MNKALLLFFMFTSGTYASDYGHNWQMGFFESATDIMEKTNFFHNNILLPIITLTSLLVLGLMIWLIIRYREKKNPIPSTVTHNTPLEIIWTIVPVLILLVISIFSVKVLVYQTKEPAADVTIKAIGYQWYWGYEYPEENIAEYSAYMLCPVMEGTENGYDPECVAQLKSQDKPHKLATDNPVVVPVGQNIRILTTAMDVIHAWTIPAFGVKKDAIPGRMNSMWFNAKREGTFYGQCSELCGAAHAFMPITVEVVSQNIYQSWLSLMKEEKIEAANMLIETYKNTNRNI